MSFRIHFVGSLSSSRLLFFISISALSSAANLVMLLSPSGCKYGCTVKYVLRTRLDMEVCLIEYTRYMIALFHEEISLHSCLISRK